MRLTLSIPTLLLLLSLGTSGTLAADTGVRVIALFAGKALLKIGDQQKIEKIAKEHDLDLTGQEIVNVTDDKEAAITRTFSSTCSLDTPFCPCKLATPRDVVARASKPICSSNLALPASHGLGRTKGAAR